MSLRDKLKPMIKYLKVASVLGTSCFFVAYHFRQTCKRINNVINPNVLDREKKYTPEYIYIDDPSYGKTLEMMNGEPKQSVGFVRIWKSLKHSLAWRMLWLCRHGNRQQRDVALLQLAKFKNNKDWDCLKIAQAMDKNTAVLLARTQGADLRYFLPPPIHVRRAAKVSQLMSFTFRDLLVAVENLNPHSCIKHFLQKYFTNIQDQAMEADSVPAKPDSISERDLCLQCLDAIHHHISLFHQRNYETDSSTALLIEMGLLPRLAELFLRLPNDTDIDLAILKILTVLSVHCELLDDFFHNGLIRELSRLVRYTDVRVASSAAVALANLSGEFCYRPGLYLLHPIFRTTKPHTCDTLLVHGLRGGVFVTWRQRDPKCAEPLGLIEVTITDVDCDPCEEKPESKSTYIDPDFQQVIEDLKELEDESLLSDYEVVLHDLPIQAKREVVATNPYITKKKRAALIQEEEDRCNYTFCWPKDWLPRDCDNLRIMGVNYFSSLSEWLERCPLQTADIAVRAADLAPALIDADVGKNKNPIVWLAHSMGGLIVKQLLIDAAKRDDMTNVCDNTKAIVFYSTPHKGSSLATMHRAAAAILWPSNDVRQLQQNSPVLLDIHNEFVKYADIFGWETVSFAESKPTLVTAFKVPVNFVEESSADLGRGVYYELPLDHLAICKPATRQSILYTTVLDILLRATQSDRDLPRYNPVFERLLNSLWWLMQKVDDNSNSENLHWFERFLIDIFSDGFTD